ncbi:hypothetical protein [Nonomuraea dietziae]|uniref:hypothetical protein n=1 Tax=Nonomuraea dietziae TaxID=65515 RepID=UPI0031DCFB6D
MVPQRAGLRPLACDQARAGGARPARRAGGWPSRRRRMPRRLNAVGDAFSGRVQLRWITSRSGRVVIVDDGRLRPRSALLELLSSGPAKPLLRARRHSQRVARHAGPARGAAAARRQPGAARCRSSPPCPCRQAG